MIDLKLLETEGITAEEAKRNAYRLCSQILIENAARKKKVLTSGGLLVGAGLLVLAIAAMAGMDKGALQGLAGCLMAFSGIVITFTVSAISKIQGNDRLMREGQRLVSEGKIDPFQLIQAARDSLSKLGNLR